MAHFNLPANVDFTVDTSPMAQSIDGVSHHVDGVTTAVVAMQTAVIIAEQKASDKICTNLNKGFYTLIRSQISQKIARLKSVADSKFMELQQQSVALGSIKIRMEKDYMMIATRYTNLFNSLNKTLRSRIFELDKPTTDFVNRQVAPTVGRIKQLSASPTINQTESITLGQMISTSNTKYNALRNISVMGGFIASSQQQGSLVSSILFNEKTNTKVDKFFPIIIVESGSLNVRQNQWDVYSPEINDTKQKSNLGVKIQSRIFSTVSNTKWSAPDETDRNSISQEFSRAMDKSAISDRLKKQMFSLLESSNWQAIV